MFAIMSECTGVHVDINYVNTVKGKVCSLFFPLML